VLLKLIGRRRQTARVDRKQRIERFDFDVEPLHQRHRHAAKLGEPTAHTHLADGPATQSALAEKQVDFVGEPAGDLVARSRALAIVLVSPRDLARRKQGAAVHDGERGRPLLQRHIRFDRVGNSERAPHA